MPQIPDQIYYSRGQTRILFKKESDGRFFLTVNGGEPTPLEPRELADLLSDWGKYLVDAGYPIRHYDRWPHRD